MRLSELVERCKGGDPELMIDDRYGMPRQVVETDLGFMLTEDGARPYVLLEIDADLDDD